MNCINKVDLIEVNKNNEVAGFILFNTGKYAGGQSNFSVHELFVAKSFRSRGIATRAVNKLLEMYKGTYRVEQLEKNKLATKG